MEKSTFTEAAKFFRERRVKRRRQAVVFGLAFVIVGTTAWGLLQKGHAMTRSEGVLDCQYEIHTHSGDCYADGRLVCGKVEYVVHAHDEACYDEEGELACQLPEKAGHVHNESCFETEKVLICDLAESEPVSIEDFHEEEDTTAYVGEEASEPEILYVSETGETELICGLEAHSHGGSCYSDGEKNLVCGQSESEGHSHSDSCYKEEKSLKCDNEDEDHEHDDDCYETSEERICDQSESEGHSHSDDCYEITEGEFVCDKEEHEHTVACYAEISDGEMQLPSEGQGTSGPDNGNAGHEHDDGCYQTARKYVSCGEEGVHTHDDSCYQDGSLICEVPVVESLEKHAHDEDCFKAEEDVEYTRIFENDDIRVTVSYKSSAEIAKDAELLVEEITDEEDMEEYEQRLEEEDVLAGTDSLALLLHMGFYTGDEVFKPKDQVSVTVEFLNEDIYAEDDEIRAAGFRSDDVEVISGTDGLISFETEELPELGFIVIGEDPHTLTYESDDYIVTVVLDEETNVPEDAELVVEETTQESGSSHFKQRLAELEEEVGLLDEEETIALLLDMRILADGKEMPLEKTAEITVQFLNNNIYFEGDVVKAAYFTDGGIDLLSASDTDSENATTFEVDELAEAAFIGAADMRTMTCEGDGFIVTVRFGKTAEIPEDAVLNAERITQESDPEVFAEHEDKLKDQVEEERITLNVLMDIGFYVDDEEIEPQDTVDVKIKLLDREGLEGNDTLRVIHFAEDGVEVLEDPDMEDEESSLSTAFQLDSFSVIGIGTTDNALINNASAFCKAINNAQEDDIIVLDGDFTFPGDQNDVTTPNLKAKNVTLCLNGYTITLGANVTLINIGEDASLTVADRYEGNDQLVEYNKGKTKTVSYNKTEVDILDKGSGMTSTRPKEESVSGGAIVGKANNDNAIFYMSGGALTIEDGIMTGNGGRVVYAENADLNLKGGYLLHNSWHQENSGGGAVICIDGTLTVDEDVILSGNSGWEGGAIRVEGDCTANVKGGYITNNESRNPGSVDGGIQTGGKGGGGIRTHGEGVELNISGGYITGNSSVGLGGGVCLEQGVLNLTGGYISGNIATENEGGGLAVYTGATAYIGSADGGNPIYITENETKTEVHWGGGGIFISEGASAYLYNTLITQNSAGGFGGGVGGCSTGRILEAEPFKGAAIYGNKALGQHYAGAGSAKHEDKDYTDENNNPAFWQKENGKNLYSDYFCALYSNISNEMLGGGSQGWDGSIDGERIDTSAESWQASYITGLTANPTGIDEAKRMANVYITGNDAYTHGGAIMCNGVLVIGSSSSEQQEIEVPSRIELTAVKQLVDGDGNSMPIAAGQFRFAVYADVACTQPVATAATAAGDPDKDNKADITFGFLTFNLARDQEQKPSNMSEVQNGYYNYSYYIKEEALSGDAANLGIAMDDKVYRMTVTVKKSDHGVECNIHTYVDDIVRIKIETGTVENGQYKPDTVNYKNGVIYEDTKDNLNGELSKYSDDKRPLVVSLTKDGIMKRNWRGENEACQGFSDFKGESSFVNVKQTATQIKVDKNWSGVNPADEDSVTVELRRYQGDKLVGTVDSHVLNADNNWEYTWSGLSIQDDKGNVYDYRVEETAVAMGKLTLADFEIAYDPTDSAVDGVTTVQITNTLKNLGIELLKNDESGQPLSGAGFAVLGVGNTPLSFIDNGNEYLFCEEPADGSEKTTETLYTGADGTLKVTGLRAGTYMLREVEVPFGYTAVDDHKIILSGDTKNSVTIPAKVNEKPDVTFSNDMHTLRLTLIDKVKIYRLPESGGIGTRIFYVLGSIMVLGSLVLLITRKRLSGGNNKSN